jgi:hypothetical protein
VLEVVSMDKPQRVRLAIGRIVVFPQAAPLCMNTPE